MEQQFNGLNPAEHERLAGLLEELGEAQQVIGKILRHGYKNYNPNDPKKTINRRLLETELGHVLWWIHFMETRYDLDRSHIDDMKYLKGLSVNKYLHHQDNGD